ncbi:hypothetical protein ACSBOB_21920 [Mesorhizobium sp. ASY16-5R]|uniref:hypothetical protein n=1 Tax=Mesorhizobium sp. ASY16-5R TaxID=3445772 RepID=UPI003FA0721E
MACVANVFRRAAIRSPRRWHDRAAQQAIGDRADRSHGSDARGDFPKRDDNIWLRHSLSWRDADGKSRLDYRLEHLRPLTRR